MRTASRAEMEDWSKTLGAADTFVLAANKVCFEGAMKEHFGANAFLLQEVECAKLFGEISEDLRRVELSFRKPAFEPPPAVVLRA